MTPPHALLARPRWLLWRYIGKDARKMPFQTNGQPAKSNAPATWTTFEAADAAKDGHAGLGYVLGDGVFGIDLDGCVEGDVIQQWAIEVLAEVPTYAEYSPSGSGIKLFGLGEVPGGKGRKRSIDAPACGGKAAAIEVYGSGRYFAYTGLPVDGCPDEVAECQGPLDALYARLWPPAASRPEFRPADPTGDVEARATAYLRHVPPAVAGSGGHNHTFRVACILVLGFRLSPERAYGVIQEWNAACQPPWSERELRHKLGDADKQPGERGWLLDGRGYSGPDVDLRILLASLGSPAPAEPDVKPAPGLVEFPRLVIDGMPRLMRLAYDWSLRTALKPQPQLSLAALIALFGAVFGRKVRDFLKTRTNIMVLCIAPSGSGKEHPRQCNKEILFRTGLDLINGPERVGSHAGIVSSIAQHPVRLFQLDEIGRMLATMRDASRAPHLWNIGSVLMQLYSSAGTLWTGDAYADVNKVKRIQQPCVCVYGTSVPDSFYGSLTIDNLSDGMVSRFLVLEVEGYGDLREPAEEEPPLDLIEEIKAFHTFHGGGGNLGDVNPAPAVVPYTPDARARHLRYCQEVNRRHPGEDAVDAALWSRAPEKASKLALIYAMCVNWQDPQVNLEAVNWARALANYSTRRIIARAKGNVDLSLYEKTKRRLLQKIVGCVSLSELTRRSQWLRQRERAEILDDLVRSGLIAVEQQATGTQPRTVVRRL